MASEVASHAGAAAELSFCDIGANLLDPVFRGIYRGKPRHEGDFDAVLERAKEVGVKEIMVTAGCLQEAKEASELVEGHPMLFFTVGVHPTRCSEIEEYADGAEAYMAALLELVEHGQKSGKVVAIGECGLDWDRTEFCPQDVQLRGFERHFELAEKTGLPMFLHNRNTGGVFSEVMSRHPGIKGVVHSFDGPLKEMEELVSLGLSIGINGCSLKTAENLEVAAAVPLDRLMIETDAPWCDIRASHAGHAHVKTKWPTVSKPERFQAGQTVKGRCEPCHIRQVAEVLAGVRSETLEEIAEAAYRNATAMFFPSR